MSLAAPHGRASSIHSTPPTVTAAPACHAIKPTWRTIGPIKDTKAIMAMVQAMFAASSGRKGKGEAEGKGAAVGEFMRKAVWKGTPF